MSLVRGLVAQVLHRRLSRSASRTSCAQAFGVASWPLVRILIGRWCLGAGTGGLVVLEVRPVDDFVFTFAGHRSWGHVT